MKLSYFLAFLGLAGAAIAARDSDDFDIDVPDIVDGDVYYDGPGVQVVGDLPGFEVDD